MSNRDFLLLLGAGASYGSESNKMIVPPLTSDLFDALLRFETALWQQVPADIAQIYRDNFEAGMVALAAKIPQALPVIQRSMGAFFYRYGPSSESLYFSLARKIRSANWKGAIATLNYERMLPLALSREHCAIGCGGVSADMIEICFPHGCCNLFCESAKGMANAISMAGMNVTTNGPVVCVDHPDQFWHRIRNDAFPPVMSYFEPSKFTTSGANFIEGQRKRLSELIANASSIAVVGIQVREEDSHIWNPLCSSNAPIYYCSGKTGAAAYKDWQSRVRGDRGKNDRITNNLWNSEFDAINAHIGLR